VVGPVGDVRRDALEVALLTKEALVLDEEPDLPFEHVVDLLGDVAMRPGVVARRPGGDHHARLVAVGLLHRHRALALLRAGPGDLALFDVVALEMEWHRHASFPDGATA